MTARGSGAPRVYRVEVAQAGEAVLLVVPPFRRWPVQSVPVPLVPEEQDDHRAEPYPWNSAHLTRDEAADLFRCYRGAGWPITRLS